jgi:hypothetical protein
MAKLIAVLITYNEEALLPDCLESIYGKADEIVMVEGRIADFPGDNIHSADNTIAIAESYGATVIQNNRAWHNECEMRSAYLVGNAGDVYFHIDADERLMTPLPCPEQLPGDAYKVSVNMIGVSTKQLRPRFFRHKGMMEYRGVHDALFSDDTLVSNPKDVPTLHSVWLTHAQMLRDKNRRAHKEMYYRAGYVHEPAIRKDWNMYNVKT